MSVEERLRQVFSDVLGVPPESVAGDTSPQTVAGWDSVAHLNLVLALEGEFGIQFEAEEIPELVSFRAVLERLEGVERTLG